MKPFLPSSGDALGPETQGCSDGHTSVAATDSKNGGDIPPEPWMQLSSSRRSVTHVQDHPLNIRNIQNQPSCLGKEALSGLKDR